MYRNDYSNLGISIPIPEKPVEIRSTLGTKMKIGVVKKQESHAENKEWTWRYPRSQNILCQIIFKDKNGRDIPVHYYTGTTLKEIQGKMTEVPIYPDLTLENGKMRVDPKTQRSLYEFLYVHENRKGGPNNHKKPTFEIHDPEAEKQAEMQLARKIAKVQSMIYDKMDSEDLVIAAKMFNINIQQDDEAIRYDLFQNLKTTTNASKEAVLRDINNFLGSVQGITFQYRKMIYSGTDGQFIRWNAPNRTWLWKDNSVLTYVEPGLDHTQALIQHLMVNEEDRQRLSDQLGVEKIDRDPDDEVVIQGRVYKKSEYWLDKNGEIVLTKRGIPNGRYRKDNPKGTKPYIED